uniref:Uncharacterized protein n=1 Tax=Gasterosteus aculeatus TaxID=69293 RepID=G3Q7S6_GASAC
RGDGGEGCGSRCRVEGGKLNLGSYHPINKLRATWSSDSRSSTLTISQPPRAVGVPSNDSFSTQVKSSRPECTLPRCDMERNHTNWVDAVAISGNHFNVRILQ